MNEELGELCMDVVLQAATGKIWVHDIGVCFEIPQSIIGA